MFPADSVVIYPLILGSSPENYPHCKHLLRKSTQDQPSKPWWNLLLHTLFLEEEVCVLKLTFLALLPAESKQIACQTCPM